MGDDQKGNRILTIQQASEYSGLKPSTIYSMTSLRQIRHFKPGGKKIYILEEDLRNYLLRNPVEPVIAQ